MISTINALEGQAEPLGPTVMEGGVNFAVFSAHATAVSVCLFSADGLREVSHIALTSRTGDVWHGFVPGLKKGQLYGYRVDGPYDPHNGHRFNRHKLLIDPYAKSLFGAFVLDDALYGYERGAPDADLSFDTRDSASFLPKCVVGDIVYDGASDAAPKTEMANTIIYECHIKGLTQRRMDVPEAKRGTAEGLSSPAMIKHLKSLGVTAVEILPLQSFFSEPRLLEMGLTNYWGYNPVNYFAPHNAYLGPRKSSSIQTMVKALHHAGIEVILDVVYNHTAESWELGPTLSYRGLDNKSYYHLKDDARYYENYTGCGNSLNMSHPAVLNLTISSLRYWAQTYGIDGFRFDLGPTMGRSPQDFDRSAPFFKTIENDPILSKLKLIAEPWDIGPKGYQLGAFPNGWSEWNDQYRDVVRSFWRGDAGAHQALAGRLLGSAETFDHDAKSAVSSVNFISAHDGFTLEDTVSFHHKHNEANGEQNRDGHGNNLSDNMGVEGPTDDAAIQARRRRRKVNMLATLLLSQGVPMLLAGDEIGQSQQGNNNAYCQDNEITWLDWSSPDSALQETISGLIKLRQKFQHFRQQNFLHGEMLGSQVAQNAAWINAQGSTLSAAEWEQEGRAALGLLLSIEENGSVLVLFNRGDRETFELPRGAEWQMLFSSGEAALGNGQCVLPSESVTVLQSATCAAANDIQEKAIDIAADLAGIIPMFRDISGHIHTATQATKSAILDAMNWPQSTFPKASQTQDHPLVYGAEKLRREGKVWGVTMALYGLRSRRNWGIGDFEDLAQMAEKMAAQGADFIGINPVHALFPSAPHLFAPYSPSSREALNIMHIAPDKIEELSGVDLGAFASALEPARIDGFVDYPLVCSQKMQAFELAFSQFQALPKTHKRQKDFQAFAALEGQRLQPAALYDAIFETLPEADKTYDGYKAFPRNLQSYQNPAVSAFAHVHKDRVDFYLYLQWIAQAQLKSAQSRAKAAGMSIGLYLDYAVGVVPGGADAWIYGDRFARNISLGAPGDAANPDGQLWNLAPFDPHKLAANNFEPYRSSLRRMMSQAGAVRIDHILGHLRSFWVPLEEDKTAMGGAYVSYPLEGLLSMIAEESQNAKCVIIGEDLGTIPDGLRRTMERFQIMGCGIVIIERDSHGKLLPLEQARELSLTAYSNHDFPTLAGFWQGTDFKWREALGISSDEGVLNYERARRREDAAYLSAQAGQGYDQNAPLGIELAAKLQEALARSPALATAVQLEDLLLQIEQPNVPGTTDEQPNWRRKYSVAIEDLSQVDTVKEIAKSMRSARPKKL